MSPVGSGSAPSASMVFRVHFFSKPCKQSSIINVLCIDSLLEVSVGRRSGARRPQAVGAPGGRQCLFLGSRRLCFCCRLFCSYRESLGRSLMIRTSLTTKRKTSLVPIHFIGWKSNLSTLLCFYDTVGWCTGIQRYGFVFY